MGKALRHQSITVVFLMHCSLLVSAGHEQHELRLSTYNITHTYTGVLTEGDENRARAGRGKEKKHLPWVSNRAVGREEQEKDREREEKREKVNIQEGKAVLQLMAVSEQWMCARRCASSPGLRAGCRLDSGACSSEMERVLVSTGKHRGARSTKSPQAKAEGWDAGVE